MRKALERARARSNFSISEIGYQDLWQRTRIGAVSIGPDQVKLEKLAAQLVRDIELSAGSDALYRFEIIDY